MRVVPLAVVFALAALGPGCGDDTDAVATGASTGGTASGGTASGGTASGGTASGGTASGGTASGGTASGGTASGGTASGGVAGIAGDAGTDSTPPDAAPAEVTLLDQPGDVFTPSAAQTLLKLSFGNQGTAYGWLRLDLDVLVGDWQPEVPDPGTPDRTEHILFGLFRANQAQSDQRYLMGSAAVTFATKAPHFRMFGRNSIGAGYTTYTQWSATYAWQKGKLYHLTCSLDGIAHVQRCELWLGGQLEKALQGNVAYLDPATHLTSGFYVELGTAKPGDIEASPIGWKFQNLKITAAIAP